MPLDLFVYTPDQWQQMRASSQLVQRMAREGRILYEADGAGTEDRVEAVAGAGRRA